MIIRMILLWARTIPATVRNNIDNTYHLQNSFLYSVFNTLLSHGFLNTKKVAVWLPLIFSFDAVEHNNLGLLTEQTLPNTWITFVMVLLTKTIDLFQ